MSEVVLFEHNEIAYKKLCESLAKNKCTTINHATGTGKSYIALKYMEENKDKKILYLSPTYPIIDQLIESAPKIGINPNELKLDTMIYRTLLQMNMEELFKAYDIIILDEYHRAGAKQTYKKIKQIKRLLDKDKTGKKMIGLTATNIRYLNKERNMTNELFDGNTASTLTLAGAMIKGLLPIPEYISSKSICSSISGVLKKRLNRMAECKDKKRLSKDLEKINNQIGLEDENVQRLVKEHLDGKKGKYIVFCSKIDEVTKKMKNVKNWFPDAENLNIYDVHSGHNRKYNKDALKKFNDSKEGVNVLFCVDILNEGVHVEDVDAVFMFRKTVSPIIFFQQIGRLLSFSARKRDVKIFDMKNNFHNHSAIYLLFREFQEEIRKKAKNEPEKANQCKEILDKFKIMDETTEIIESLDKIKECVTTEKIIISKIDNAIDNLIKNPKKNIKLDDLFKDVEKKNAYSFISRNYRFVTTEQFKKLLDLNIFLPENLNMTLEEREELLNGFENIYQIERNGAVISLVQIENFVKTNNRSLDFNSEDKNEKKILDKYLALLPDFSDKEKEQLLNIYSENGIELKCFEKVLLGIDVDLDDVNEMSEMSKQILNENKTLPRYLYQALEEFTIRYNTKYNDSINELLQESDKIAQEQNIVLEKKRLEKLNEIIKRFEKCIQDSDFDYNFIINELTNLSTTDRNFIRRKIEVLKKKQYFDVLTNNNGELKTFCKKLKNLNIKDIEESLEILDEDEKNTQVLSSIIVFIDNNDGRLPQRSRENIEEDSFAQFLEENQENNNIMSFINLIYSDYEQRVFSSSKIANDIIRKNLQNIEIKKIILNKLAFVKKNDRNPLSNSNNVQERELAVKYEYLLNNGLISDIDEQLNKLFNTRKNIYNSFEAYFNNSSGDEYDAK